MLTRQKKEEIVKQLGDDFDKSKAVVFIDYKGIKVNETNELKKELRENNSILQVVKKNLIDLALKKSKIDVSVKKLEGQIAVVTSKEDEVSGAKILSKFAKDNENLKILGGLLEEKELTQAEVVALAKLPSKEKLLAKIVGSLNSPLSGFVNVLQGNQRNLVYALKAIADNK